MPSTSQPRAGSESVLETKAPAFSTAEAVEVAQRVFDENHALQLTDALDRALQEIERLDRCKALPRCGVVFPRW